MVIEGLGGLRYAEITGKEILEKHYTSDNNTVSFVNNDENIKSVFEQNGVTDALGVVIFIEDGEFGFIAITE